MPEAHARLLGRFATGHPDSGLRLGAGSEAIVYALDANRVLRVYRGAGAAGSDT